MTKVFGEVDIPFKDKNYIFKGTFLFINRVEQRLNLVIFEQQAKLGTPRLSDVAWIIYSALSLAGCDCTYEQVGEEMLLGGPFKEGDKEISASEFYGQKAGEIFEACFPVDPSADITDGESDGSKKKPLSKE